MKKIMASVLAAAMIMGAGTATTFTGADMVITANAATEGTYEYLKYTAYDTYDHYGKGYIRIQFRLFSYC